jgi:hypothetical protein
VCVCVHLVPSYANSRDLRLYMCVGAILTIR